MIFQRLALTAVLAASVMQAAPAQAFNNVSSEAGKAAYVFYDPIFPWVSKGFVTILIGNTSTGYTPFHHMSAILIDIMPQTFSETVDVVDKDNIKISFEFHAVVRPDSSRIKEVVENYGSIDWYKRVVQTRFISAIRESVGGIDAQTISTNQNNIQKAITEGLKARLVGAPFILDNVTLGKYELPPQVAEAAAKRQAAEQDLQRKSIELQMAKQDAQIEAAKAEGKRSAQDIINGTLTPLYVQDQFVEKLPDLAKSGNMIMIIPTDENGQLRVPKNISLTDLVKKRETIKPEEHK